MVQEAHVNTPHLVALFTKQVSPHQSLWNENCGIIIKNNDFLFEEYKIPNQPRLLAITIELFKEKYILINVYAPVQHTERIKKFKNLKELEFQHKTIWTGDFNCWCNPSRDCYPEIERLAIGYREF